MRFLVALLIALPALATPPQHNKPPPGSVESSSDAISTAYGGEAQGGEANATGGQGGSLTYSSRMAANPPAARRPNHRKATGLACRNRHPQ